MQNIPPIGASLLDSTAPPPAPIPKSITATLRDGTNIRLRPIRPDDEDQIEQGIRDMSDRSRYLRFFSAFKAAPPSVVKRLADVDGVFHIGWGMVNLDLGDCPAFAAAHIIRDGEGDHCGEFSIAILDEYQSRGASRLLTASIFAHAFHEGITDLRMDMLSENSKARRLILALGATLASSEGPVSHYRLDVRTALAALKKMEKPEAIREIFKAFGI